MTGDLADTDTRARAAFWAHEFDIGPVVDDLTLSLDGCWSWLLDRHLAHVTDAGLVLRWFRVRKGSATLLREPHCASGVMVDLQRAGQRHETPRARLVYRECCGELAPGERVEHINGDRFDCRPDNLRAVSHGEALSNPTEPGADSYARALVRLGVLREDESGRLVLTHAPSRADCRVLEPRRRVLRFAGPWRTTHFTNGHRRRIQASADSLRGIIRQHREQLELL